MPGPPWVNYLGAVLGVIGAITGTLGAVWGYKANRKADEFKSLDLRLELRKAESDLRLSLADLRPFIERVHGSRIEVAGVNGTLRSGGTEAWKAK